MQSSSQVEGPATPLRIRDLAQLRDLRRRARILKTSPIVLDLPGISPEVAAQFSNRIHAYANECGCSLGAKVMALSFLISLTGFALAYGIFSLSFLWRLPLIAVLALCGAASGKFLGLTLAHHRLDREFNTLGSMVSASSRSEVDYAR